MGYFLGIDLGTTFTAAAVMRDDRPEIVTLGNRAAAIPSLVFVHDETVLTGEAALRRGLAEPDRLAREFKRRVGDPAPILLGGVPLSAEALFGRLLRATVDAVAEREGGDADGVAVCHPANWGPYKLELLGQACRIAELDDVLTISEPEAAAIHYATLERVEVGALVAVYDLGGGTFDAAVLRKTDGGFEILGAPEGIERLGGIDFDEAVVNHVRTALSDELAAVDPDEPATLAALARLRQECVDAKEALSSDVETSIPVILPGVNTEVRLTRTEFESMIRLPIQETIAALRRAIRGAGVAPDDLAAVLLVGGSSRIPMVAEMVGAEVGRPVAVDAEPKHVVALGAARAVGTREYEPALVASPTATLDATATLTQPALRDTVVAAPVVPEPVVSEPAPVPAAPIPPRRDTEPAEPAPPRKRKRWPLVAAGVAVVALAAGGAVVALGGSNDNGFDGFVSACPGSGTPAACITSVSYDGNRLVADFTTHDLGRARASNGADVASVFFLARVSEKQAGSVRNRSDVFAPWGSGSPFTGTNDAGQSGFTAGDVPSGATALCVLLGDDQGDVAAGTGNCAELPPKP